MWSYYGSKLKLVKDYPAPLHNIIIEPFAGSAQYSLKYFDRDIILIDKYPLIIKLWKWLQQCSKEDILSLPEIEIGKSVFDYNWDCEEAKWLVGFTLSAGDGFPRTKPSVWRAQDHPHAQESKKKQIAESLYKIKHWKFVCGEYNCIDNIEATWFVDPPYQTSGTNYKFKNKLIDYEILGNWCKTRRGQVIVCENDKGNWLDFVPLQNLYGIRKKTMECIWYKGE